MIGQPTFNIHDHQRRMVRRSVVLDSELSEAIMHVAMGTKRDWTPAEINALNDELEMCELTVGQWLERKGEL